ncbi:MAG: aminodeoxychorismate/anthranilate synthase component II [Lachnospiraceae bacterium]|nr:aminodeoxychorismate/anthranilate synthase component II [Lachnospiraceae bacterium]
MTVLIDNYDSFSYNLYQMVGELDEDIRVIRNDEMSTEEIESLQPERIILSPGPGRPGDAGVCEEVILRLGEHIPILGVCLGHQAICEAYGGRISYARELMHGKQSEVSLSPGSRLFTGLGEKTQVARYHSLAAEEAGLPKALRITARTADGEVMAVEHEDFPVYGLQFHPESILTLEGKRILRNFISINGYPR